MIIVDDDLALRALQGDDTYWTAESPAIPWVLYSRLLLALQSPTDTGRLSRRASPAMVQRALTPPESMLQVLDPRPYTGLATRLKLEYRLNMIAADLLGAAIHHRVPILVAEGNVGQHWPEICDLEQIEMRVIAQDAEV